MAFIQSGGSWQFGTESDLEEVVWHNLPKLLGLKPLSRQFAISGKFCDILAKDAAGQFVVVELKNTEDRYVVQQLVRYYDLIQKADALPFESAKREPRLIAIAPSFHADTLTDCQYSTLEVELITFKLELLKSGRLRLVLSNAAGTEVSNLSLSQLPPSPQFDHPIPEPPRKLLNWLSQSHELEHALILALRRQILSTDPRMKEIVEPSKITYGKGKAKPCCELKKITDKYRHKGVDCCLWLPDPENNPHVIKMLINFDLKQEKVRGMQYGKSGYKSGNPWHFPKCIEWMQQMRYQRALSQYQPFVEADMTISPTNIVNLAIQTWQNRL